MGGGGPNRREAYYFTVSGVKHAPGGDPKTSAPEERYYIQSMGAAFTWVRRNRFGPLLSSFSAPSQLLLSSFSAPSQLLTTQLFTTRHAPCSVLYLVHLLMGCWLFNRVPD